MGESRNDLLAWLNDLLQLNLTKIEQVGTGAALCQVFDSIYMDVPLSKVKMNAKQEYEYLNNFKVLQNTFKLHKIDKPIPVERLVRCKMQDNLEFLQWVKRFWDANFPGDYDPIARRGSATIDHNPLMPGVAKSGTGGTRAKAPLKSSTGPTTARRGAPGGAPAAARPPSSARGAAGGGAGVNQAVQQLTAQMDEMKVNVEGLEKERDFYFNKLREIEILIGARLGQTEQTLAEEEEVCLKEIQAILYSTEEGFEVPDEEDRPLQDEEETF